MTAISVVVRTASHLETKIFDSSKAMPSAAIAPMDTLLVLGALGCLPILIEPLIGSLSPRRYSTRMIARSGTKFLTPLAGSISGHQSYVVTSTPPLATIPIISPPAVAPGIEVRLPNRAAPNPPTTNNAICAGCVLWRKRIPAAPAVIEARTQLAPARNCGE